MRLVLFEIFGFKVYSYGLMIAIGILSAGWILTKKTKEKGYDEDEIFNLIIFSVIAGILGGKLLFIITEFKQIVENPSMLLDFGNGFVIYGAIILGGLGVHVYCRRKKWSTLDILDSTVPGLALAQGFGRIGCFLAGCCYGAPTDLPIGVQFPIDSLAQTGVHVHPTQLYSSVFDFALAGFLIWYARRGKSEGKVTGMYIVIYSIGRFIVEFLRNDPRGTVGMLSTSQFIAIFTLIAGIAILNIKKVKGRGSKVEEN
ncbi:MAG: prolipoprotein diacylglyceryl transferase [Clostridium sp.]